jgi:hypothetical protein
VPAAAIGGEDNRETRPTGHWKRYGIRGSSAFSRHLSGSCGS